jgi:hypothetical protein
MPVVWEKMDIFSNSAIWGHEVYYAIQVLWKGVGENTERRYFAKYVRNISEGLMKGHDQVMEIANPHQREKAPRWCFHGKAILPFPEKREWT